MRLLFCTSNKIGSRLIRAFTWSKWSHVAIVDGNEVIEAAWPRVRIKPLAEVLAEHTAYELVDVPDELLADDVIDAVRSQVGKPYDWTAIVGIFLRRDWEESDSWFCSELVAWGFAQANASLFRADSVRRVTPEHLWMLAPGRF